MKRTRKKKTGDKKNMYTKFLNDNKHFYTFNGQTRKNEKKGKISWKYLFIASFSYLSNWIDSWMKSRTGMNPQMDHNV